MTVEIWYEALASPFGITVLTDDLADARRKLYATRKALGDPDLEEISVMTSPLNPEGEVWLVKRRRDAQERGL